MPFFSTKGVGKGTGLGPSMVHGLASQLGGALVITSRPGLGTNIELWLPQTEDALEGPRPGMAPNRSWRADRAARRRRGAGAPHHRRHARGFGCSVVEAASAEEALKVIGDAVRIDLLVSGYAEADGVASDLPRLAKPFRKDDLAASLASLVSSRIA